MVEILKQDDVLLEKLHDFFKSKNNYSQLVDIIDKKSYISLRIIDWFVTKHSKINNIVYILNNKPFHVHQEYKNKLKGLNKYKFDSCRRKYRKNKKIIPFDFNCTDNISIYTTIGQLNFFKWAISVGIIDYITSNYEELNTELNGKKVKESPDTKRITVKASSSIITRNNIDMTKMTVRFE
jgi:hypothetical protein